ncbi:MAG: hypothetical protein EA426_17790 [Spirochaetaceae bacterium]|nr:MAG: hypothetical protein EA426_17790 [Spirochaetaceae bacterium]
MQRNTFIYKSRLTVPVRFFSVVVVLVAAVFLGACDAPFGWDSSASGSVVVSLDGMTSLSPQMLLPETAMDVAEYRITGVGPDAAEFEATTSGETVEIENLRVGEWTLDVSAFNADMIEIGYGRSTVLIRRGETASIGVALRPLVGTGSLSLSVTWPAGEIADGNVVAALTPFGGDAQQLEFTASGDASATYHAAEIAAGYYSMVLQLRDGETVVAGAVETVRVVHGAETSGVFDFADLNHPTGDIEIIVVLDMAEPLTAVISGAADVLPYGDTMTALATVENAGSAEVFYAWYLNGAGIGDGESVVVGSDLRPGTYRLDVIVFTADGVRSGSASHGFRVE